MKKTNILKKILSILFTLLIILNSFSIISYAKSEETIYPKGVGDPYITFENRTLVKTITNHFVGYANALTPYWTKSREYEVQAGRTMSISANVNYFNNTLSLEYTYTAGASSYIPADPSRYSKLSIYDDFKVYRYTVYENYNGNRKFVKYVYKLERIPGMTSLSVRYK